MILILAGVFVGVGVICTVAAFALGASIRDLQQIHIGIENADDLAIKRIQGKNFSVDIEQSDDSVLPEVEVNIGSRDGETSTSSFGQLSSFDGVRSLNIETGAAIINILYADVDEVEVHYEDAVGMAIDLDDHELDIECGFTTAGEVEILIPEGTQLDEIDLDIGAGQVSIQNILFRTLDADVGAGTLLVEVPDVRSDYDYSIDCGLGEIQIGDETYSGINSTERSTGAKKSLDIDCGAGKVEIQFAQE